MKTVLKAVNLIALLLRTAQRARPVLSRQLRVSLLSDLSHSPTSMTFTLKPDFGKNDALFPALPEINSQATKLQVFTHRSFFARPTHIFEDTPGDLSPDNEKFEHLGDTVLGLAITTLLMETFPGLRVGPSTKIRAMVVANPTLAEISLKYRLSDHLRLHPAQAITLRASTNIQADVFEAFVGGLYIDSGGIEGVVRPWLNKLFTPYIKAAYMLTRQQHGLPPLPPSFLTVSAPQTMTKQNFIHAHTVASFGTGPHPEPSELCGMPTVGHLALFNQHIQKTNRTVEWVYDDTMNPGPKSALDGAVVKVEKPYTDMGLPTEVIVTGTKSTPVWYVKVLVDGEYFGRGRGNTKKAARNEAAKEGLAKLGITV
ncbi:ribonuclease III domain-containing protein [Crepidotus variabilis]|uniref:Ribonuclease III domain-containing protein n=1 Tax=Crepidotus variabilis TaxID=179855 RepID=A0A9P6ETL3_9AGAR|nr:ribonuclease III domain-containing protein [Crepidotus variabilis]